MSTMLKSTGGGSLWAQILWFSPLSRPMMFGSVESEHPRLIGRMYSNLCDHNPPTL